jgi:hypothetical protein
VSGLLVTNEYFYVSYSFGGSPVWSDAIFPLSGFLKSVPSGNVYCVDWRMLDSLRYLNHGKLALAVGNDPISKPQLSPEDRETVLRMLADPGADFVAHTKDFENFQGTNGFSPPISFTIPGYRQDPQLAQHFTT